MYNMNFRYVTVSISKGDDVFEVLEHDLVNWVPNIYKARDDANGVEYKGLIKKDQFKRLQTLINMSPYGNGYEVTVDKVPYEEYGMYEWKRARGIV